MVVILVSFWDGPFSGAMLVLGRVHSTLLKHSRAFPGYPLKPLASLSSISHHKMHPQVACSIDHVCTLHNDLRHAWPSAVGFKQDLWHKHAFLSGTRSLNKGTRDPNPVFHRLLGPQPIRRCLDHLALLHSWATPQEWAECQNHLQLPVVLSYSAVPQQVERHNNRPGIGVKVDWQNFSTLQNKWSANDSQRSLEKVIKVLMSL